ncbi:hypothetical protein ACFO0M_17000 [Micromonospora mangrovi]|uniref:Aminoacyl-transfer RNA synthetases class-II family profile domain-containing protein n=2 Tax=Micromonospora TaxID=1873 RepID=A0AAU7MBC7_9ACTN
MTPGQAVAAGRGLTSLSAEQFRIVEAVDAQVLEWAARIGAPAERHAELLTVEDLSRIDYFDSFPQLAHRVTPWLDEPAEDELVLTSAACYGAYFSRLGSTVGDRTLLTVRQTCRRREVEYTPLRRQREFQMREVVMIGSQAEVQAFLDEGRAAISAIAASLGATGEFLVAADPFFRKNDQRLLHQKLFPTKQEFTDASGLAIASVNSHRNFFGERCDITLADGTHAFTGCVAFGLERWVDTLTRSSHESA